MNDSFEKTGITNRIKEITTLFIFIFISLVFSLIVMDFLIFPIATFAVNNKSAFTYIVKNLFWIIILTTTGYIIFKKISIYKKNGIHNLQILKKILLGPLTFLLFFLLSIFILLLLIAAISFILQNNYYLLYRLINL